MTESNTANVCLVFGTLHQKKKIIDNVNAKV